MKSIQTTCAIASAFVMGMIMTSLTSGCQKTPNTTSDQSEVGSRQTNDDTDPNNHQDSETPTAIEVANADPGGPAPESVDSAATGSLEPGDWPQWGGNSYRNNAPVSTKVPTHWAIGEFDRKTGEWNKEEASNIKWVSDLGSLSYGNAVISNKKIFCGTNNGAGYVKRYPDDVDLGCLICFNESDGEFLWQHSSEKLAVGRAHDWPLQGICCTALAEGSRLYSVTSRGEVVCLDTEGYYDGEDDGRPAGWGRLFDLQQLEEPEQDPVAPAITELKQGNVSDNLRQRFAAAGAKLPADVAVKVSENGRTFSFSAKVEQAERKFELRLRDSKLSGFRLITVADKTEADEIWVVDMMSELGVAQHNMCSCSVTAVGDVLFVNTSNGIDEETHTELPAPDAPSFIAIDKNTGKVLWTDKSPGENILHGQWSSPAAGVLDGVPQVIFNGGDGWVYSFKADAGTNGKPELLWKFDANPKTSKWILGGRGTRNNIIATPVIHKGLDYVAVGQDPENGEGQGHVWCIDPTKRGDVSPQLAMRVDGGKQVPIEHRRIQAVIEENGEVAVDNENSAVKWHYSQFDQNGDGKFDFEEKMHRSCGTVAIKDNLLYISDFSGLFHCLDATTGKVHWTYDMLAQAWGSPLIVNGHVYIGDEDGDVCVFRLTAEKHEPINEINMDSSVYSTPVVANDVLYISTKNRLFAIAVGEETSE